MSFTDIKQWPQKFDNYIDDHFFLRSFIIRKASQYLFSRHFSISSNVIIGKSGWLFLSDESNPIDKCRGIKTLSDEEAGSWVKVMSSRADFLKTRGIDCWVVIVPDKATIYPQYLPDWCAKVGPSFTDSLVKHFRDQNNFKWIDLRPMLLEASKSALVYRMLDTHWNDIGSYLAYKNIMQKINSAHKLSEVEMNDLVFVHTVASGDLAGLLSLKQILQEDIQIAKVSHSRVLEKKGSQDISILSKDGFATTSSNSTCRALILCDSFTISLIKYFQETFSYAFFKHHQGMEFDKDFILRQRPDILLYIVTERLMPSQLN